MARELMRLGVLELDRVRRDAAIAGHPLTLSPRLFALLAALMERPAARPSPDTGTTVVGPEVLREALVAAVYGPASASSRGQGYGHPPLDQHLYRLRRALRDAAAAAGVAPPAIEYLPGGPTGSAYRLVA